jgi:hypothetical protein
MTEPDASRDASPSEAPEAPVPASMTQWGRRVALGYLAVCALVLIAMVVEAMTGESRNAGMFAAFLTVPWSMLLAGLAPQLPSDGPFAVVLAARMVPLALLMLLNAAIVAGIAARSERDLSANRPKS